MSLRAITLAGLMLAPLVAGAHEGGGFSGGFSSGFMHPILGWDHVAAMVAVGLWGAVLGSPAIWVLPILFPLIMALGGALGVVGIALPGVKIGIAASGLVLGALILFHVRAPLWLAVIVVGTFAVFHGHAHGTELPHAASPLAYSVGFVISTGLLHLCGVVLGLLNHWRAGKALVRACGLLIALAGATFLAQAI